MPSPPPGMPVDVHSGTFRLWQIQNGSSFHGCIQNLYINNELQDFTKTQMKPGVVPGCEPCRKIYCLHGICQPDGAQGPVCHCQPGWNGLHCDQPSTNPCQGSKYVSKSEFMLHCKDPAVFPCKRSDSLIRQIEQYSVSIVGSQITPYIQNPS